MALNKVYTRINWEDYPSENTDLDAYNLNQMDSAIDALDNRIISQDALKVDKSAINGNIADWNMDETTGIITITKYNGEKVIFDLNIEKIPVGFSMSDDGIITMTTEDGTQFTADIGSMIPVLTFEDSATIAVSVNGTGKNKTYSFSIKTGSVTDAMLQPNYLADIRVESANASAYAQSANAKSVLAESYAIGGTGTREGEDTDNAKYYMEQAKQQTGGIPTKVSELENDAGYIKKTVSDLENYYDNNKIVRIPADIMLTPSQNSQKYYKEYRKKQVAESKLNEFISEANDEADYFESVIDSLSRAETDGEITAIKAELASQGYIKKGNDKKKEQKSLKPMHFKTRDGFDVYVGRNNIMNDKLTMKTAKNYDTWFHVQSAAGSHVICETSGNQISDGAIHDCAVIAAYFSKARESSNVAVDYTLVKNVRKPNGAKPGFVVYDPYKTEFATPTIDEVESLKDE